MYKTIDITLILGILVISFCQVISEIDQIYFDEASIDCGKFELEVSHIKCNIYTYITVETNTIMWLVLVRCLHIPDIIHTYLRDSDRYLQHYNVFKEFKF